MSPLETDSKTYQTATQGERLPLNRYALFFLPLVIGSLADLISKSWIFSEYYSPELAFAGERQAIGHWWIEGIFGIETSTNAGALFGIGQGHSTFFAAFSVIALVAIFVWLFPFKAAFDRWLTFALGMISGGIIGNFYDRVGWGYDPSHPIEIKNNVRDWIFFRLEGVPFFDPWPNFNIADMLLVTGAIMLLIHAFFLAPPEDAPATDES